MTEHDVLNAIIRAYGTRTDCRVWRQNTGAARYGQQVVRFGVPGQADLTGLLADGRRLEIEVKSSTGRQSPAQAAYQAMIERFGGIYILARSVADVADGLERAGVTL